MNMLRGQNRSCMAAALALSAIDDYRDPTHLAAGDLPEGAHLLVQVSRHAGGVVQHAGTGEVIAVGAAADDLRQRGQGAAG
jgi:hypothetical protein